MLFTILNLIYQALFILILARVILSWVRVSPYDQTWGPLVRFIYQATEPLLAPIRNALPSMGGLDISPIILLLGLRVLMGLITSVL